MVTLIYHQITEYPISHQREPYKTIQITNYELVLDPVNGYHLKMSKMFNSNGDKISDSGAIWWFKKIDKSEEKPNKWFKLPKQSGLSRGPATVWNPEWPIGMP